MEYKNKMEKEIVEKELSSLLEFTLKMENELYGLSSNSYA